MALTFKNYRIRRDKEAAYVVADAVDEQGNTAEVYKGFSLSFAEDSMLIKAKQTFEAFTHIPDHAKIKPA